MAKLHTFKYLRSKEGGIKEIIETKMLTQQQAIKFNCLDCAGGLTSEVKACHIEKCPLWVFRPYQDRILACETPKNGVDTETSGEEAPIDQGEVEDDDSNA